MLAVCHKPLADQGAGCRTFWLAHSRLIQLRDAARRQATPSVAASAQQRATQGTARSEGPDQGPGPQGIIKASAGERAGPGAAPPASSPPLPGSGSASGKPAAATSGSSLDALRQHQEKRRAAGHQQGRPPLPVRLPVRQRQPAAAAAAAAQQQQQQRQQQQRQQQQQAQQQAQQQQQPAGSSARKSKWRRRAGPSRRQSKKNGAAKGDAAGGQEEAAAPPAAAAATGLAGQAAPPAAPRSGDAEPSGRQERQQPAPPPPPPPPHPAAGASAALAETLLASRQLLDLWSRKQAGGGEGQAAPDGGREGEVSRRAGESWRSALDAAAAVATSALAEQQRDRRQAQQLLRVRLEQLHRRHAAKAAREGERGDAPAAQPSWSLDAAEALCGVGLAPKEAAQALLAAQEYALRRSAQEAQQAGGGGGGSPAAQADLLPPIGAPRVEAVCRELLSAVPVPMAQLHRVLVEAPQLLACTPEELRKQHEVLLPVWRRPRRLAAAIQEFPAMLCPDFPAELSAGLGTLSALGFTREQVSKAILRWPAVVQLSRAEIVRTLRRAGLLLDNAGPEVFQLLSEHPRLLGREGGEALRTKLLLLRGWLLPPPLCPLVLARCPALLEESDGQLQEIANIFVGYGATWEQLHAVVLGYPTALRLQPELVRLPLKLLADFGLGMDKVAEYPRLFIHDPVQYLGPRLAFLKVYSPEKLRFKLVTLLSRGDEEFAVRIANRLPEEYAVFKDAWVRQFEEHSDLPLRPGMRPYSLSRALWAGETTEDLWL